MKRLFCFILLLTGTFSFAQFPEFKHYSNGLIYSDSTVSQLKFIVDSLNLKFRICDVNKTYFSNPQALAHFISMEKGDIKSALKDISAHISYEDFKKKYDSLTIENNLLVTKFNYKNYEQKDAIDFVSFELNKKYGHEFIFDTLVEHYNSPLKGKWIYRYYEGNEYYPESVDAFYFLEEFSQIPLPVSYARMVQYSDCMIDTSSQIFTDKARKTMTYIWLGADTAENIKMSRFMNYTDRETNKPHYSKRWNKYWKQYRIWDSTRFTTIDRLRSVNKNFDLLLQEAVQEALTTGESGNEFEEYVARYYSKKTALELKRNRIVVGGCSQDQAPRDHALNIAKLSAEAVSWDIFLRAHLDIMNDRFERMSDGSYVWGRRNTYIKELEVLDINISELLLGITFRIENPSQNHYFGDISRTGRALSESNDALKIETKMLEIISDNQLDSYNRLLFYYLFMNYNYYLTDKEKQTVNTERLKTAAKTLPAFIADKILE